jgi:hypothetical protein
LRTQRLARFEGGPKLEVVLSCELRELSRMLVKPARGWSFRRIAIDTQSIRMMELESRWSFRNTLSVASTGHEIGAQYIVR